MSFDSKTNTISSCDQSELTADMGAFFLKVLRDTSSKPGVSKGLVDDWKIVESWLDCAGRELGNDDFQKFGVAWRSYWARGVTPSVELEPVFKKLSRTAKEESWRTEKLPPELIRVFDRMVATDKQIQQKPSNPDREGA